MQRRVVAGIAAGAVAVLGAGGYAVLRRSPEGTFGVASDPVVAADVLTVAPSAQRSPTASGSPSPTAAARPTPGDVQRPSDRPTATTSAPAGEARPTTAPPEVPDPPPHPPPPSPTPTVVPTRYGLPDHCISYFHSCAYAGGSGSVPGGPATVRATSDGESIHVTWEPSDVAWVPAVEEYVVQAYRYGPDDEIRDRQLPATDPDHVTRVRVPLTAREYTFEGLPRGAAYDICVFELNAAGIGGVCAEEVRLW